MKKLAITIAAVFATLNIFAQGTVNFQSSSSSLVYDDSTGIPVLALGGTTFSVALYWAAVDPLNPTVQPAASAFAAQTPSGHVGVINPTTGLYLPGKYQVGTVTIAGITPPGGMGWFQVKAWETLFGNSFESANGGLKGVSNVIKIPTADPTTIPAGIPKPLTGLSRIDLVVPEPAMLGLGLLGGAALLLLRRRK